MNQKRLKNTLEMISCILLIIEIALCTVSEHQGIQYTLAMISGVGIFSILTYMTCRYERYSFSLSVLKCEIMLLCAMYAFSLLTHQYKHMFLGVVLIAIGMILMHED